MERGSGFEGIEDSMMHRSEAEASLGMVKESGFETEILTEEEKHQLDYELNTKGSALEDLRTRPKETVDELMRQWKESDRKGRAEIVEKMVDL